MTPTRYRSEEFDARPLGQSLNFEFSGQTAKNRFLKASMTERMSTWHPTELEKRGIPTPEIINLYQRWGGGGFGIVLSGNVLIEYDHLESAGNAIIPSDAPFTGERFERFSQWAEVTKKHGSLAVMQVSHPGRQVTEDIQKNPISASDVQLKTFVGGKSFAKPRAMEKPDFERVIGGFVHAADYAHKSGWDGVQLHGAHGYLLAQFLAPSTNKRTDQYGGSLTNRSRLILEIADAIRARVPKTFILGIKINSVEFQDGGFSTEDCSVLCGDLMKHGFDFVELSGGTYEQFGFKHAKESTKNRESFFLDFAEKIIPGLEGTKAYVTGGFRTGAAMASALQTVDGIGLGRPAAHDFELPQKILDGRAQGAIDYLLSDQDFGPTALAAGMQMRLVGKDKEPIDLSHENHKKAFEESVQMWIQSMANNEDGFKYEGVDLQGVELQPYGTPYAAAASRASTVRL